MLQYGSLVESCISYCEIFRKIYAIDTRSPVLSVALSDCGKKNEFYNMRFRTNKIYVYIKYHRKSYI